MSGDAVLIGASRCPSLEEIVSIALGARVVVEASVLERLDHARRSYLEAIKRGEEVYGYCTGLGELLGKRSEKCDSEWEKHILVEHAMTVGDPAPERLVRAFLAVRLSQLARGRAPVRGVVAKRIADALNKGLTPRIRLHGSVGASGDLAPSAEAFLCIFYGEGEALDESGWVPCREKMREIGLEPLALEPGEALALINNTAWSTAVGILAYESLRRLWDWSLKAAASTLRVTGCNMQHYSGDALDACMHGGVRRAGERLRDLVGGCDGRRLQDPYSLRCTPQVAGAAWEALEFAGRLLVEEACSSTENPIVAGNGVRHWCGFHSIHVALAIDSMKLAASYLANLSERRVSQLLRKEITGLPDFLAGVMDSVGAMITQYTAAALAARARWAANPQSVHSIPTSGLQEDIVPMTPEAGYELLEAVRLLSQTIALELAVSKYAGDRLSGGVERLRRLLDEYVGLLEAELLP